MAPVFTHALPRPAGTRGQKQKAALAPVAVGPCCQDAGLWAPSPSHCTWLDSIKVTRIKVQLRSVCSG